MKWDRPFTPSKPIPGEFRIQTTFADWRFSYYVRWSHSGSNFAVSSWSKAKAIREVETVADRISEYKKANPMT